MLININIPEDKKEIIKAFNALINAFKNDIEIEQKENKEVHSKDDFNIMDYAGIIKTDISDNIKKIKLNDKEYRTKYGMIQ